MLSKLDYCNSLLVGSAKYQLDKLQHIQNMACHVICRLRKYDHITNSMESLHWLRIREWITYKIAMIMFKVYNNIAPKYLENLPPVQCSKLNLRSSDGYIFQQKRCKLTQVFNSCITSIGPRTWNNLPISIRKKTTTEDFKKDLKTNLFKESYN